MLPILSYLDAGNAAAYQIPFAMLVVFGAAKILAEISERLGQPGLVGEIVAGILIGPSVLGWIAPNEVLDMLSNMGAMFLLFGVGLAVKSSELLKVSGVAAMVATLGVLVPLLAGWGTMLLWGSAQTEALFVGAALVATSVGITAQVLAANGWLQERASKILLAAAVIDDVQGLIVLAVVSSLAKGAVQVMQLVATAVIAFAFVWMVAKWGTQSMARIIPTVESLRASESKFAFAMILLFALSLAAVYLKIAAIVGAFLAGLALAESSTARVKDLTHGVTELLVPFFLVGIGLKVDLRVLARPELIILTVLLTVVAISSKLAGCGLAALRLGKLDAWRIGIGMIPRGEVGMIVAQLGLTLGVINGSIYSVVVLMAVATTIIPLPFLKLAYRGAVRSAEDESIAITS